MNIVITDLDGTLLDSQGILTETTKETLITIAKKNNYIVIATGRSIVSVEKIVKDLGIDIYVVLLNGALIMYYSQKNGWKKEKMYPLSEETIRTSFAIAHEMEINGIANQEFYQNRVRANEKKWIIDGYDEHRIDVVDYDLTEFLENVTKKDTSYYKLTFKDNDVKKLNDLQKKLAEKGIISFFSDTYYLESVKTGVNKGSALQYLCDRLKIDMKQSIAFGDQENDREMIQMSGKGIAMKNALPAIKAIADDICLSNDNEGVAKKLQEIFHLKNNRHEM